VTEEDAVSGVPIAPTRRMPAHDDEPGVRHAGRGDVAADAAARAAPSVAAIVKVRRLCLCAALRVGGAESENLIQSASGRHVSTHKAIAVEGIWSTTVLATQSNAPPPQPTYTMQQVVVGTTLAWPRAAPACGASRQTRRRPGPANTRRDAKTSAIASRAEGDAGAGEVSVSRRQTLNLGFSAAAAAAAAAAIPLTPSPASAAYATEQAASGASGKSLADIGIFLATSQVAV